MEGVVAKDCNEKLKPVIPLILLKGACIFSLLALHLYLSTAYSVFQGIVNCAGQRSSLSVEQMSEKVKKKNIWDRNLNSLPILPPNLTKCFNNDINLVFSPIDNVIIKQ